MKKRILSLVTALMLCLSVLPAGALALETEEHAARVTVGETVTEYTDIAEAFRAASGQTATITLLAEKIAVSDSLTVNDANSKITLELNGKQLRNAGNTALDRGAIAISAGELIVQDSTEKCEGWVRATNGRPIDLTGGSLTVKSGKVMASDCIGAENGAKVTVDGGTVIGGTGIKAHNSTVVINGGVVLGTPGVGIYAYFGASVTVTGGFIKSSQSTCFYNYNSSITISDGFISSESDELDIPVEGSGTGTVSISGGWFSKPVAEKHCAEGYAPTTEPQTVKGSPVEDANWYTVEQLPTGTVTFHTNGGSEVGSQTVIHGNPAVEPEVPTRAGYAFDGWYTDEACTNKYTFDTEVAGDLSLYAKWTEIHYTVTVAESEHGTASASAGTAAMGTEVTLTAAADSGYQFKEWQVTSGEAAVPVEGNVFTMPAGNVTVQAVFEALPSRPSQSGGGGGGSGTYPVTVEDARHGTVKTDRTQAGSGNTVTITVTPDEGYELDDLTVADSRGNELALTDKGNGRYTFRMPSGRVTVEAVFTAVESGHECLSLAFTDLDVTAWYHEAVDYALENGLMGGYGSGLFAPNKSLSRAMLCQILYNLEDRPAAGQNAFDDVAADAWCAGAVAWANANGIVGGYGDGCFGPSDPITREQLAAILWRYARYKGYDTAQGGMAVREFSDYESISGYAVDAMTWAVNTGVVGGYGDQTLRPQNGATRAQAAQMLMNFLRSVG